jgi:hypothetical protein
VPDTSLSTAEILALLAAGPPRIAAATAGLTQTQLHTPPEPEAWSFNEILAHLRACADMWGKCIAEIIARDHPTLQAVNPRGWIKKTDYREQMFHASLEAFTVQRTELLATLAPLPPAGWERSATVRAAGKPLERTVRFYARWLATHERSHLKAIERMTHPPNKP